MSQPRKKLNGKLKKRWNNLSLLQWIMNICNILLKYQNCPLFCQDWCLLWLWRLKLPIRFSDTNMKLGSSAISYIMNALKDFIFSLFYAVILLFLIYSKWGGGTTCSLSWIEILLLELFMQWDSSTRIAVVSYKWTISEGRPGGRLCLLWKQFRSALDVVCMKHFSAVYSNTPIFFFQTSVQVHCLRVRFLLIP